MQAYQSFRGFQPLRCGLLERGFPRVKCDGCIWPGAVISGDEICSNPMSAYWPTPERQLLILRIADFHDLKSFAHSLSYKWELYVP
jgi:hypothetical protein